jgi:DNA repair photolyase
VDDDYIARTFGLHLPARKDPSQRAACGCVVSKDIGMYDSCLFGCQYCYATSSFETARRNHAEHDPELPSLIGRKIA